MSYSEIYGCGEELGAHYCDPCLSDREFARARSGGYIKKSYLATILADPTSLSAWQTGITNGNIIMIPETSGSYDPGDPAELRGYGDRKITPGPREMTLELFDPNYRSNYAFFNSIGRQTDLVPFFRTSSLVHIFDTVATIVAKDPVEDNLEGEVVWQVINKVTSENLPSKHSIDTIKSIFVCNYVAPPAPAAPFTFYSGFGTAPTTNAEVEAGNDGTATHNQTATVVDFANPSDAVLWYAEPVAEPAKTKWWNTNTNTGNIGAAETFLAPTVVGSYRLYVSGFATSFDSPSAVEFRVS